MALSRHGQSGLLVALCARLPCPWPTTRRGRLPDPRTRRKAAHARHLDAFLASIGEDAVHCLELDTQGSELDILRGAALALDGPILAVKAECEFVPQYLKQPLFGEVDAFLRAHASPCSPSPREACAGGPAPGHRRRRDNCCGGTPLYLKRPEALPTIPGAHPPGGHRLLPGPARLRPGRAGPGGRAPGRAGPGRGRAPGRVAGRPAGRAAAPTRTGIAGTRTGLETFCRLAVAGRPAPARLREEPWPTGR